MKFAFTLLLSLLLASCFTTKVIPMKGSYPETPMTFKSEQSFETTWDKLIDVFAQKGLAIKIIDKSSGLVISERTSMPTTIETKDGQIQDEKAFIVVPVVKMGNIYTTYTGTASGAYSSKIRPKDVLGEWNVRVKPDGNGSTINVNITNVVYRNDQVTGNPLTSVPVYHSTGVFEKALADLIRK